MSQGADDPIRGAQICLLNEHLPYELDMLLATYRELSKQIDDITRNALIESFWLHARNLREFYDGSATLDPKGSAAASHFTGRRFRPNFRGGIDAIINQQITHLQYGRPSGTGKLKSNDMKYVLEAILSVTRRFQAELRPEWARHFAYSEGPQTDSLPQASATNSISTQTSVLSATTSFVRGPENSSS